MIVEAILLMALVDFTEINTSSTSSSHFFCRTMIFKSTYQYSWTTERKDIFTFKDETGAQYSIGTNSAEYPEFLKLGITPTAYVAPAPVTLTTEQKIAAAGFDEGELEDFLVAKIQARLNE